MEEREEFNIIVLLNKDLQEKKCIYFPLFRRFFILLLPHRSCSEIIFIATLSLSLSELDSFITCGDPCPVRDELEAKNIKKEMMKMNTGTTPSLSVGGGGVSGNEWESRPGGMVVQRRTDQTSDAPRVIRVRVKYLSVYHEININSQSSFGELKKVLSGQTGLHHEDMKILYKDKERDSKMFLDLCGVKDRSKLVLKEDPMAQEKRLLEKRRNAVVEKAMKSIADIGLEVDRLAGQVSAFETVINKGGKVEEKSLVNLIEMLMNQLLRLDAITADGDVKLKRKMQVKRVQTYVETLDVLKVKNSTKKVDINKSVRHKPQTQTHYQQRDLLSFVDEEEEEPRRDSGASSSGTPAVVTNDWEKMFDSTSAAKAVEPVKPVPPRFKWEFFD